MSTDPQSTISSAGPSRGSVPAGAAPPGQRSEVIKLVSHSNLFYWWPVWVLAFIMAFWTYIENHRLAIVPAHGTVNRHESDGSYTMSFGPRKDDPQTTKMLNHAVEYSKSKVEAFPARISQQSWVGSLFVVVLILTMIITNVPLRGLWSFIVIMFFVVLALFITVMKAWDDIFDRIGNLHIYINMAGYLFIGIAVFIPWALATWIFDRRSYVLFEAGSVRVCEHVGAAVQVYPTIGMAMEKQRDDIFRHYILGFGSGDLILRPQMGNDRKEIRIPNVLGIGWRLRSIEEQLGAMKVEQR